MFDQRTVLQNRLGRAERTAEAWDALWDALEVACDELLDEYGDCLIGEPPTPNEHVEAARKLRDLAGRQTERWRKRSKELGEQLLKEHNEGSKV